MSARGPRPAWTATERHWRSVVLDAVLPHPTSPPSTLGPSAWEDWHRGASPLLRLGLRVAVWWATWRPALRTGRPLHRLEATERREAVASLAERPGLVARQLLLVLKLVAGTAAFGPTGAPRPSTER